MNKSQQQFVNQILQSGGRVFLEGPAGAGKTTAAVAYLEALLRQGASGEQILILLPQRTLAGPYERMLRDPGLPPGGRVTSLTLGGLAQRLVDFFWPLVVEKLPFRADRPPTFLTLETAQYYMAHLARPLLDQGLFEAVRIEPNRLYSQILDNLNKAAVVGFPVAEIGERLQSAWLGDPVRRRVFADVQACASLFREYCLAHNLLDFSLQVEIFRQTLWPLPEVRAFLLRSFRCLVYDNLEEDTPVAHDLVAEWLPALESALLIYDWQAGYRSFLGADPQSAEALRALCEHQETFSTSLVTSAPVQALETHLSRAILPDAPQPVALRRRRPAADPRQALFIETFRFYPQMLDWVADQAARLVQQEGIAPGEIAILSPFLSDALRFSLGSRLQERGLPFYSHRPSRSLRDEPVTRCLLTLAALANPHLGWRPVRADLVHALLQALEGIDLARAQLLAEIVFHTRAGQVKLTSFDEIRPEVQERITYRLGARYERLRLWLAENGSPGLELDHFLSRLFGELLSQPGFGFHRDFAAGAVTANLIESIQKFRWAVGEALLEAARQDKQPGVDSLGAEYLRMLQDGVVAAQYLRGWQEAPAEAILLAPAYTFLLSNRPVDFQFWLDVGSRGWGERLNQPLTHPYVLSRHWTLGRPWTDLDEIETSQLALHALTTGLLRRCRRGVFLGLSVLGESGYEQRGPLQMAFQRLLQGLQAASPARVEG